MLAPYGGWFTKHLLNSSPEVVEVIEQNSSAIEVLTRTFSTEIAAEKLKVHKADVHTKIYEFQPNRFDALICTGFLYHTPHPLWVLEGMTRLQPESIFLETFDSQYVQFEPEKVNDPGMRQSEYKCLPVVMKIPKSKIVEWMRTLGYEISLEIDKSAVELSADLNINERFRNYFSTWKSQYAIWFRKIPTS